MFYLMSHSTHFIYGYMASEHSCEGVFIANKIPLTTIVTYSKTLQKQNLKTIGPLYPHAVWYLPFTNRPRKHAVTYHFSDLQEVYSGNRQIYKKCQLQYLHPPQISTSGKCHCNNLSDNKSY